MNIEFPTFFKVDDLTDPLVMKILVRYLEHLPSEFPPKTQMDMYFVPPDILAQKLFKPLFMGAGVFSVLQCGMLHRKLDDIFSALSGLQQLGLQGTPYDYAEAHRCQQDIERLFTEMAFTVTGKHITFVDKDCHDSNTTTSQE